MKPGGCGGQKGKSGGRIVGIIALTPNNEVILIKIFRIPFQSYILEFCAGLMDKKDESEEQAARRELLEETGYAVQDIQQLMKGSFHAGLAADELTLFLGTGAKKVQEPTLDNAEEIEVVKIPLAKLYSFLTNPHGHLTIDIKIFCAMPWLDKISR